MNPTTEKSNIIEFSEINPRDEQNARNNYLFRNGSLRFDLGKKDYFWTNKVNQNIINN